MSNQKRDECPRCRADLTDKPILEKDRDMFGGATHFSRRLDKIENDRCVSHMCPDCGYEWARK